MKTNLYCAFNVTRQSFINLGVTVADTPFARLRSLFGKVRMRSDEAVWVVPARGVHSIGLRIAIDVLYLDAQMRVVQVLENLGPLRIPPARRNCVSVLKLPARSIFDSGTQVDDQLLIGSPEDLSHYWDSQRSNEAPAALQAPSAPDVGSVAARDRQTGATVAFWKQSGVKVEHRRAPRLKANSLVAHYWTGGLSAPRQVQEISMNGALIAAPELYYPGTLIRIALEDTAAASDPGESIPNAAVWGRVVRKVSGGFCVAFVFESRAERAHLRRFLDQFQRRGLDETKEIKTGALRRAITH